MGITQAAFADKLHITRAYLSQLETGREPSATLQGLFDSVEKEWRKAKNPTEWDFSENPTESDFRTTEEPGINQTGGRAVLKASRIKKGLSMKELCKAVGYTEEIYDKIENGTSNMSRQMAEKVAKALDISVEDLLDGSDHPPVRGAIYGTVGERPDLEMPPGQKARFIPLLSMAQCGGMMAYDDTAYDHSGFIALNPKDGKAFALTLAGDSMTPDIRPGDTAVVYPSFAPRNGSVVIAKLNEANGSDVMLKLYQQSGETVTLSSYNPAYPPMTFPRSAFQWIYPVASVMRVFQSL